MKSATVLGSAVVVLVGVILGAYAIAEDAPAKAAPEMTAQEPCPMCMMACGKGDKMSPEMKDKMKEMMKEAGITDEMMMHCHGMMAAPLMMNDPAVLLGMAKGLELTDEQKTKLMDIQKEACGKAMAVLTDEQKTKLGKVPETPLSPMGQMKMIHEKMKPVMMKEMKEGKMPAGCPMMHMKSDKDKETDMKESASPKEEGEAK